MAHQFSRQRHLVQVVAGRLHGVGRPLGGIGRVRQPDVAARQHHLYLQHNPLHALCVGDSSPHRDRRAAGRYLRPMFDLVNQRGQICHCPWKTRTWSRGRCPPRSPTRVVCSVVQQLNRLLRCIAHHRPGKPYPVRDLVDLLRQRIAQHHLIPFIGKPPLQRAPRTDPECRLHPAWVDRNQTIPQRRQRGILRKFKLHTARQRPASQRDRSSPGVVKFDKFEQRRSRIRVVMQLGDDHGRFSCLFGRYGQGRQEKTETHKPDEPRLGSNCWPGGSPPPQGHPHMHLSQQSIGLIPTHA